MEKITAKMIWEAQKHPRSRRFKELCENVTLCACGDDLFRFEIPLENGAKNVISISDTYAIGSKKGNRTYKTYIVLRKAPTSPTHSWNDKEKIIELLKSGYKMDGIELKETKKRYILRKKALKKMGEALWNRIQTRMKVMAKSHGHGKIAV